MDVSLITEKLPGLKTLLTTYGDMTLIEYARTFYSGIEDDSQLFQERKDEFLGLLQSYCSETFDETLSGKVITSLRNNYSVSTAEHMGPLGHSFFFQSAVLRGLVSPDVATVNFCTSHVSLGNSSYPRGLLLHDSTDKNMEFLKLPLFSAEDRMKPVFDLESFTISNIQRYLLPRCDYLFQTGIISKVTYDRIHTFIDGHLLDETIQHEKKYSHQLTRLNFSLWQDIFGTELPDFIGLDAEEIVCTLLVHHMRKNTALGSILTDTTIHQTIEKLFDGIQCCFDREKKSSTYLFWYLDQDHARHALWRDDDNLVNRDLTIKIALTGPSLISHLSFGKLIPSGLLVYGILNSYYGITCFGGFSQGTYLPLIQDAFDRLFESIGTKNTLFHPSAGILCEDMNIEFDHRGRAKTALDLILSENKISRENLLRKAGEITIEESIKYMVPEILKCL